MKKLIPFVLFFTINFLIAQDKTSIHDQVNVTSENLPINKIAQECSKIGINQTWKINLNDVEKLRYRLITINNIPSFNQYKKALSNSDSLGFVPYHHFDYFKKNNIKQLLGKGNLIIGTDTTKEVNYTTYIDSDIRENNQNKHSVWYIWTIESSILFAINEKVSTFPSLNQNQYFYYSKNKLNNISTVIYPNPTINNLTFSSPNKIIQINIFDNLGIKNKAITCKSNEVLINISDMKKGTYKAEIILENSSSEVLTFVKI